jgi:hypothetical protein
MEKRLGTSTAPKFCNSLSELTLSTLIAMLHRLTEKSYCTDCGSLLKNPDYERLITIGVPTALAALTCTAFIPLHLILLNNAGNHTAVNAQFTGYRVNALLLLAIQCQYR